MLVSMGVRGFAISYVAPTELVVIANRLAIDILLLTEYNLLAIN
jgi:hypothetical protein